MRSLPQRTYLKRVVGSSRRKCLDQIIVVDARSLFRTLLQKSESQKALQSCFESCPDSCTRTNPSARRSVQNHRRREREMRVLASIAFYHRLRSSPHRRPNCRKARTSFSGWKIRSAHEPQVMAISSTSGRQVPSPANGRVLVPVGSYVQGVVAHAKRSGHVSGRAELTIRLETLTYPSGRVVKFTPKVTSVDAGPTGDKVTGKEGEIEAGSTVGQDVRRITVTAGSGAAIGGLADHSWEGAGIGAGIGTGVGVATALLTRGRELDLRRGTSLDVVFDRAMTLEPQ